MPQAIRAGLDCQTFWRSNPKRLKQFCEARTRSEDVDLQAWATGYYVASAFAGKFPKQPELFKQVPEMTVEEEARKMALEFEAWAKINNRKFENTEEVTPDGH